MRVSACLALCLILGGAASAQSNLPPKYQTPAPNPTAQVAIVDGKPLTGAEVEPLLWEWYGRPALQDVISFLLVSRDAANRGIVIADTEVEKTVDEQMQSLEKSQNQSPEQAKKWLEEQGFTRSRLFLRLKAKLLMERVLLTEFHPENYVKVSTILVRPASADATAVAGAISKAQAAYDRLIKGDKWDEVLKATTSEEKSVPAHGVLGWREISAFPPTVQQEFSSLKPGGFTKPAQTSAGIQVFRLDARGADAKGSELEELKSMYLDVNRPQYVKSLQSKMKVLLPPNK